MHGSRLGAERDTSNVDALAQALVATFGDRAPVVVGRQIGISSGAARESWQAILVRVGLILGETG